MEQRRGFQSTRWSLVLRAKGAPTAESKKALNELCETCRPLLIAFARRLERDATGVEDLVQSFFETFVEKKLADAADPERGSFRAFLCKSLSNCHLNARDAAKALKRGGGAIAVDAGDAELRDERTAERLYERLWARSLLDRVLAGLADEETRAGRGERFEALRDRLVGGDDDEGLRAVGAALGMKEGAVKVALHRLRKRYGMRLREEVAETVSRHEDVDAELRELLLALREEP